MRPRIDPPAALYVAYWSLEDPLSLSQALPVVRALAADGRRMVLVTFEQRRWNLQGTKLKRTARELKKQGVSWIPLRYHKRPRVMSTVFDVLYGTWVCARIGRRYGVRLMHGRGTVAAMIAYASARACGAYFLNDADGPLSEEYADAGVWSHGSVQYRLTRRAESHLLRSADAVAVLTTRRRDAISPLVSQGVAVVPCGVDTSHFTFRDDERHRHRAAMGLRGTVFVYAGKGGGWYLTDAMLDFVAVARVAFDECSLLVLTNDDPEQFRQGAAARGLYCIVRSAARGEMPGLLSAGDAGLSFVLSAPSKTAASPVKNGEYLACGLPVVTTAQIGDYSELVVRRAVGVVVSRLDATGLEEASVALARLLAQPGLRERCREAAISEVDLATIVLPSYRQLYDRLLGAESRTRR